MTKITRTSMLTGKTNTIELPISREKYLLQHTRWRNGSLIQDAFPTLSDSEREFIKTGITQEEWEAEFPEKDE